MNEINKNLNEFSGFNFVNNACFIMDMLWVHYSGEKNVMHLNDVKSFFLCEWNKVLGFMVKFK